MLKIFIFFNIYKQKGITMGEIIVTCITIILSIFVTYKYFTLNKKEH